LGSSHRSYGSLGGHTPYGTSLRPGHEKGQASETRTKRAKSRIWRILS
jgi:hypothetical protein